jgi:hypothetical protein
MARSPRLRRAGGVAPLLVVTALCLALVAPSAACAQAYVYFGTDLGTIPYDQALMVLALQGIVNRDAPRLYANTLTLHPWASGNPEAFRNDWDEIWVEAYAMRGYQSEAVTSVASLVQRTEFRPLVSGLVIYDPSFPASTWIAFTIAGAENRLPVTAGTLASLPQLSAQWPDQLDLRGRFSDKLAAYWWTIDYCLASSSTSVAYTIGHDFPGGDPGDFMALDYAVAKRAFVFDLSLDAGAYPDEAALADTVVRHLVAPAALMGWYSELVFCDFASMRGDYALNGVCAANLSFHRQIPPASTAPLQQTTRLTPDQLSLDPTKYYLAFVWTDGDIPQRLTRYFSGHWFDAARGQVPVNWAVDPVLVEEFPGLFEYFYSSATQNDYFLAGPSSAGYTHPSVMPNRDEYAALVARVDAAADIDAAVVWDYDLSDGIWGPFLAESGLRTIVHDKVDVRDVFFRGDHVPFLPPTFFVPWYGIDSLAAPQIAGDIAETMSTLPTPSFAIIYDPVASEPDLAKQVMGLLTSEGCVFLRLDEMGELARQIDHFHDVGTKYWAHDYIEACFQAGVVQGYTPLYYRPTLPVDRAQMAVYISRALAGGDEAVHVPTGVTEATFGDVDAGHWAYRYVEYCAGADVVHGYPDGGYRPGEGVNRGQMSVYVSRADAGGDNAVPPDTDGATFTDVTEDNDWDWCYRYVEYCATNGIVQGYPDDTYRPANPVTRDQMAVYVARAFDLLPD